MTTKDAYEVLVEKLGPTGFEYVEPGGDPFVRVAPERILDAAKLMRDDPRLACEQLQLLSGVDTGKELWVVYHLFSFKHRHMLVLKVVLGRENPSVSSVTSIWPAANWHERETYDLFGVQFTGHPDLRRILLPPEWKGHPLRKDYPMPEQTWPR